MKKIIEYLFITIGSLLVGVGLELILAPNGLVDGGTTALSIMAEYVFDFPLYLVLLSLNIPILLFTAKDVGRQFVFRTLYANIITTLALILFKPMEAITDSEILIVLYGGVILGIGIGMVVKLGGAIDGTEMLAVWFNNHFNIPVSTFLLGVNAIILTVAAFVYSLEQAMFSLAVFYIVTKMIDFVLDGMNQGKSVMIISSQTKEIGERLIKDLNITVTYLVGEGGYSGESRTILYCITNRFTYPRLKAIALAIDPNAVLEASFVTETSNVRKSSNSYMNDRNQETELKLGS